eukprot:m.1639550 g.1639550  ORF g.1639550 m.1639550 type:complete len:140 (-) comp36436_c0_seq1:205-624(-)
MEQRISLITLGVTCLERSRRFYEGLGWKVDSKESGIAAFNLNGAVLGLYPWEKLAHDMGVDPDSRGPPFSTISYNVRERAEVAPLLELAKSLGGDVIKDAHDVFWGGHIGYFRDLDGHIWEVAHNPHSQLGSNGEFQWN